MATSEARKKRMRDYMRERRANPDFHAAELNRKRNSGEYQRAYIRQQQDPVLREKNRIRKRDAQRNRRKDPVYQEKHRVYMHQWHDKNPNHGADWRKANPDKTRNYKHNRRAAEQGPGVSGRDWSRIVNRHQGMCAYCFVRPYEHMDHVVPLTKGGLHSVGNVLPACQRCNQSKGSKLLVVWKRMVGGA